MDTSLKRSKKIKAIIYRLIMTASLFVMVATSVLEREALVNLYLEGPGTFTGSIYYLTQFREYISSLYSNGMLGYAGIGDDNGYPLTSTSALKLSASAQLTFKEDLAKSGSDIIYHVLRDQQTTARGNCSYPLFSEYDDHLLLPEDVTLCCYWDGENLLFFPKDKYNAKLPEDYYTCQYKPNIQDKGKVVLLLAVKDSDSFSSNYLQEMARLAKTYRTVLIILSISASLTILFGIFSLLTKKAHRQGMSELTRTLGNLWLEVKLLLTGILLYLCYSFNLWFFEGSLSARSYALPYFWLYIPAAITLYLLWQDLKYHKLRFFKSSLIYTGLCFMHDYHHSIAWFRKAKNIYIISFLSSLLMIASSILFLELLPTAGVVLLLFGCMLFFVSLRLKRLVADTSVITAKLSDISQGISSPEIVLGKHSLLTQAAADLNTVEDGIEAAVEQTVKANKMRVELITNVSHDLKTPLTSIINYADLLCEEKLPAPADGYAASLRSKAYRLKSMVQDVFELSKATSGNLPVEIVRLDLAKLIRQTLADMDEKIQASTLTFKLNIQNEPLMIDADGDKLYRVFQNLISNALQYSLEHSRVYIQLDKKDTQAVAWIKNTSKQELDFDPDEIVERFVRADASRTTEGSGLGLSIVQSFTEACGGSFSIELNADLFIACVSFPLSEEAPSDLPKDLNQTIEPTPNMQSDIEKNEKNSNEK